MRPRIGPIAPVLVAILCLSLVGAKARPRNGVSRVQVFADRSWQETGIELGRGEGIVIAARGSWSHGTETGFEPYYDADGFKKLDSTALMPRVWVGTLLGRIGDGRPFPIGENLGLLALRAGPLLLSMNDVPGHFANNKGSLEVRIELHSAAKPRPTAAGRRQ